MKELAAIFAVLWALLMIPPGMGETEATGLWSRPTANCSSSVVEWPDCEKKNKETKSKNNKNINKKKKIPQNPHSKVNNLKDGRLISPQK